MVQLFFLDFKLCYLHSFFEGGLGGIVPESLKFFVTGGFGGGGAPVNAGGGGGGYSGKGKLIFSPKLKE